MPYHRLFNFTITAIYLAAVVIIALDVFLWRP